MRVFEVETAATDIKLTTLARARSHLNLSSVLYDDTFVGEMIDTASAMICTYLDVESDGVLPPTIGRERIVETFRNITPAAALTLARAPIVDVVSVEEDGVTVYRVQTGADGAVDIVADATAFSSASGPGGAAFNASHVGRQITIVGAGAAAADHVTTIAALVDDANVTLTDPAATTVAAAAYTIENLTFPYEWRAGASLLHKVQSGNRTDWRAATVRVVYDAGWVLPGAVTGRNLPLDIEDACVLLIRRKIDQLRESDSDNQRIKSESIPGVGSWTFAIEDINWQGGMPSDVRAMLDRYRRRTV